MADERASEPNLVFKANRQRRDTSSTAKMAERSSTLKKVDENYFNRHFAHTPQAIVPDNSMKALKEAREEDEQSAHDMSNQRHRASF